jgi:hypothetical protein
MLNTLKKKTLYVYHENSGSQGPLKLNDDTSGTYEVGQSLNNVTWSELWVGDKCALWVMFDEQIKDQITKLWGFQLAMYGSSIMGTGMSALGNATPQDKTNTTFMNEDLTIGSSPKS